MENKHSCGKIKFKKSSRKIHEFILGEEHMNVYLKENFLLGVASAATQIEGGELNHTWNDWYHKGKISNSVYL